MFNPNANTNTNANAKAIHLGKNGTVQQQLDRDIADGRCREYDTCATSSSSSSSSVSATNGLTKSPVPPLGGLSTTDSNLINMGSYSIKRYGIIVLLTDNQSYPRVALLLTDTQSMLSANSSLYDPFLSYPINTPLIHLSQTHTHSHAHAHSLTHTRIPKSNLPSPSTTWHSPFLCALYHLPYCIILPGVALLLAPPPAHLRVTHPLHLLLPLAIHPLHLLLCTRCCITPGTPMRALLRSPAPLVCISTNYELVG